SARPSRSWSRAGSRARLSRSSRKRRKISQSRSRATRARRSASRGASEDGNRRWWMDPTSVQAFAERVREQIRRVIVGQDDAVRLLLAALLCEGHVLLEGVPGTGKTLLVQALAATLDLHFNRIQFTPDLMPGDVIGSNLFNFQSNAFTLVKGPVFTDLLLADEINRAPPK